MRSLVLIVMLVASAYYCADNDRPKYDSAKVSKGIQYGLMGK